MTQGDGKSRKIHRKKPKENRMSKNVIEKSSGNSWTTHRYSRSEVTQVTGTHAFEAHNHPLRDQTSDQNYPFDRKPCQKNKRVSVNSFLPHPSLKVRTATFMGGRGAKLSRIFLSAWGSRIDCTGDKRQLTSKSLRLSLHTG